MGDRHAVPNEAGVYMVCAASPVSISLEAERGFYAPLYVGRASSLNDRFLAHCKKPTYYMSRAQVCYTSGLDFWFCLVAKHEIAHFESTLINCFGPSVNRIAGITATIGPPVDA